MAFLLLSLIRARAVEVLREGRDASLSLCLARSKDANAFIDVETLDSCEEKPER